MSTHKYSKVYVVHDGAGPIAAGRNMKKAVARALRALGMSTEDARPYVQELRAWGVVRIANPHSGRPVHVTAFKPSSLDPR